MNNAERLQKPGVLGPEELIFVGICDLAGQVRGKSIPARDFETRLREGVGYTPANICLSVGGLIGSTPFGTVGDIVLMPDASTEVHIALDGARTEHFCLADIVTKKGKAWDYCPRHFLRRALERLEKVSGCRLLVSFEQEFVYTGAAAEPRRPYALSAFREQGRFGELLMGAVRAAGMTPDAFLAEYGPRQYEVTVKPAIGMRAADEAVLLRELARSVALGQGARAIFSPMLEPEGTGNGTHIHMSLRDGAEGAAMYDGERAYGLSARGEQFIAGILAHMPALTAVTAPSVCSYYRLTPDRWAPTWSNVSAQDRAASLRVCPGTASQFNVEYRVADATACPYLALGALVHAGVDGMERELTLPPVGDVPFGVMNNAERWEAGMRPLPRSLGEALDKLRDTPVASEWFGTAFLDLYIQFKREEEQAVAGLGAQAICDRYAAIF